MAGRRGHGEGSIYKDKDGRWRGVLDLGWQGGRRKRKYFSGATRRDVQQQLDEARRQHEHGTLATGPRQTVEQFLVHWLEAVQRPKVEPSTYAREEGIVRHHLVPAFGKRPLVKLTPPEIQAYYAYALATSAPSTLRLYHAVLHGALDVAVKWGLIARNPADLVEPPKVPKKEHVVLDEAPARAFLRAAEGHRLEALFILALTTGMRIGELLALQWSAVDLERQRIVVERKLLFIRRDLIEGAPKSQAGRRIVELCPLAVDALRRHRVQQAEVRLRAPEWPRPDLVFTNYSGRPLHGQNVNGEDLPRLLRRAGLPKMTVHELRHSMITLMLSRGESVSVVAQMVGHSNVSMTLGRYRHILPNEQRAAVERLGALLTGEADDLAAKLAANDPHIP
jgi:integrase